MLSGTFRSRYAIYILSNINEALEKQHVSIIKDPEYLNKKGEYRFLMMAESIKAYKDAQDTIALMIGNYLQNQNQKQKLMKNTKPNIPPPLNIII